MRNDHQKHSVEVAALANEHGIDLNLVELSENLDLVTGAGKPTTAGGVNKAGTSIATGGKVGGSGTAGGGKAAGS